jgi:hypothetical protein
MKHDFGLENLLNLDGFESHYPNGYWYKIEVRLVTADKHKPHGIRYTLTLHDNYGKRIFGIDNKHAPFMKRKGYHGKIIEYDHIHKNENDKGTPYAFVSAEKLLIDFWQRVDEILSDLESGQ